MSPAHVTCADALSVPEVVHLNTVWFVSAEAAAVMLFQNCTVIWSSELGHTSLVSLSCSSTPLKEYPFPATAPATSLLESMFDPARSKWLAVESSTVPLGSCSK